MLSRNKFKEVADPVVDWIDAYFRNISEFPVKSKVRPGEIYGKLPELAPEQGESMENIMADFEKIVLPGISHWQHPNFHAYFPANSSVESVLAEFLTSAIGAQCMIWETSPAGAELEQRMMEWLRDALGLPAAWEGVIQDSASSATLTALLSARERCTDFRANEEGVPGNLRVYCSTEAHSSVEKAVGICGIGRNNLVKIDVDEQQRLVPEILEQKIIEDKKKGLIPCAVVAALGTTATVGIDPLEDMAEICQRHQVWLHVDAAFAGSALLLPEYRWMSRGMEKVDSFVFNPHKWLFTNFDCSAYFIRDVTTLIRTFEILPEYLKTATRGQVNDYRDWGVQLGRRFRALKLWFVLRSFGIQGLQDRLRAHIELQEYFCREMNRKGKFEFLTKPILNFSCFRYKPEHLDDPEQINALNREILRKINERGKLYLTHTLVDGSFGLRMIIGQTYTEKAHVDLALREIEECIS